MNARLILAGVVLAAVSGADAAPPRISVPDEAELTHEKGAKQDEYALPVASFSGAAPTVTLTGHVVRRSWRLPAAERTVTTVLNGYRRALEAQGFRRLLDCRSDACGGFDFRFGAELLPAPAMAVDVRDFAQLTVGREGPAGYASIVISQVRDHIYVQVVTVDPTDAGMALVGEALEELPTAVPQDRVEPEAETASGDVAADDTTVAEEAVPTRRSDDVPDDGRPLLDRLLEYGHVPVAGLAFASGGSKLTEDSGAALDEMARMLRENPDLAVAIVGHSDNRGPLNVNIELSRRRAAAVRSALVERGVKANRLEARGVGYLAPRRSNATEDGRALNRRVELVLR